MVDYEMKKKIDEALIQKADLYKKEIKESTVLPVAIVEVSEKKDGTACVVSQIPVEKMSAMPLKKGDTIILDFGAHQVGYVTLKLNSVGSPQDSPAFIRLKFGEVAKEILEKSEDYNGWISKSWIQEEFIHIDILPAEIKLPRRYAFRYLELQVIDTSVKWQLIVEGAECRSVSAIDEQEVLSLLAEPQEMIHGILEEKDNIKLEQLKKISLQTLKNCMQDVFEDGPKRDRRLWLGDLRLQALANYASFRDFDLVKRCLYLFAALTRQDGKVGACLFTEPVYQPDNIFFFDYSLFFICTLRDYYKATGECGIVEELWDCAARQLEISGKEFDEEGWIRRDTKYNSFIDWKEELDKQSCSQAVYIYAANALLELANVLKKNVYAEKLKAEIQEKKQAAWKNSWKEELGLFVSGPEHQISYATQTWMILSGVIEPDKGRMVLKRLEKHPDAVGMNTPYMNHHYTEALFLCGETKMAIDYMNYYWGGMAKQGADTFWELYNPENPQESPYGSSIVNSYCHAWSCTPVYLMKKYIWKNYQEVDN